MGRSKAFTGPVLAVLALLAPLACGIDQFIYLYPPTALVTPESPNEPLYAYFSFRTTDEDNTQDSVGFFKGWEVYYRLYNSATLRSQDATDIATKNDKDPANVYSYVVNTKKYRRMTLIKDTETASLLPAPLLSASGADRTVTIRPIALGEEFPQEFTIDKGLGTEVSFPTIWRTVNVAQAKPFEYEEIDSEDGDVSNTSSAGTDTWYVQAYAFAYGFDESFKAVHSKAAFLGSLIISE